MAMQFFHGVMQKIENLNRALYYVSSLAIVLSAFILTYEVIVRYVLRIPTIWEIETSVYLTIMATYLGAAYGLKDGGVLPGGFMPIRAFASGGIADRPTFGIIGEGGGSEAVIPLKGGKVPVEMRGGSSNPNINFTIIAADTKDMDRLLMDRRSLIVGMVSDGMRNASSLRDSMRRSM